MEKFNNIRTEITLDEIKEIANPLFKKYGFDSAYVYGYYADNTKIVDTEINFMVESFKHIIDIDQWNNIVKYMNVFNPMIGAFLAGSNANIDADKLIINNICSEFANMIKNQKLDKYIHEFIYNHFGMGLKIDFDTNKDTVTEIFQKEKDVLVKEFISTANDIAVKNSVEQPNKPKEISAYNTQKSFNKVYFPKNDGEQNFAGYRPPSFYNPES